MEQVQTESAPPSPPKESTSRKSSLESRRVTEENVYPNGETDGTSSRVSRQGSNDMSSASPLVTATSSPVLPTAQSFISSTAETPIPNSNTASCSGDSLSRSDSMQAHTVVSALVATPDSEVFCPAPSNSRDNLVASSSELNAVLATSAAESVEQHPVMNEAPPVHPQLDNISTPPYNLLKPSTRASSGVCSHEEMLRQPLNTSLGEAGPHAALLQGMTNNFQELIAGTTTPRSTEPSPERHLTGAQARRYDGFPLPHTNEMMFPMAMPAPGEQINVPAIGNVSAMYFNPAAVGYANTGTNDPRLGYPLVYPYVPLPPSKEKREKAVQPIRKKRTACC